MSDYRDYVSGNFSKGRENIEWSQFYAFNAQDSVSPRVVMIGDSISCQYKDSLRAALADKVNITSWGTSKCVTDPTYLRCLDYVLDYNPYQLVMFNNGLHSLSTPLEEWKEAYLKTIEFIRAKNPFALISLILSTPLKDPALTETVRKINEITRDIASAGNLPAVDLFTPMDALDRETYWADVYHFRPEAIKMQTEILSRHILSRIKPAGSLVQKGSATGPSGAIR